jgi:hypothetical protein
MRQDQPVSHSRYGLNLIGDQGVWREAIRAYYEDQVEQAFELVKPLGATFGGAVLNWYRLIEGEARTRELGTIREVEPWLSIETIDSELEGLDRIQRQIREACISVADRLGWTFEVPVLVSVLTGESDAPWHSARYGYAMDKIPYDKVCLPSAISFNSQDLEAVTRHEFAHIVTLNKTANRAPTWLEEGISQLVEGRIVSPLSAWLAPHELQRAFGVDRREAANLRGVGDAYAQALALVDHLHKLKGDQGIRDLLNAFTNNSLWDELKIGLFDASATDEAIHEVYGFNVAVLFEAAVPRILGP